MEKQLEVLKKQSEDIYDIKELKQTSYHLHSILMHDG